MQELAGGTLERIPNPEVVGVFMNPYDPNALAAQKANDMMWAKYYQDNGMPSKAQHYAAKAGQRIPNPPGDKIAAGLKADEKAALAGQRFPVSVRQVPSALGILAEVGAGFYAAGMFSIPLTKKGRVSLYNRISGGEDRDAEDRRHIIENAARAQMWASGLGVAVLGTASWMLPMWTSPQVAFGLKAPESAGEHATQFILDHRDGFMGGALFRFGRDLANAYLSRNPEDKFQAGLRRWGALDPSFTSGSFDKDGDLIANPEVDWEGGIAFLRGMRVRNNELEALPDAYDDEDIKTDPTSKKRYVVEDGKKLEVDKDGIPTGNTLQGYHGGTTNGGGFLAGAGDLSEWTGDIPPAVHIPSTVGCGTPQNHTLEQPKPQAQPKPVFAPAVAQKQAEVQWETY